MAKSKTKAKAAAGASTRGKPKRKTKTARTDWDALIVKLQSGPKGGTIVRKCSTPGVAQVTRCRLIDTYEGIGGETDGVTLTLYRA